MCWQQTAISANCQEEIAKGDKPVPNYIIMAGNQQLDERVNRLKTIFPSLTAVTSIQTSFVDNLAHWLNPKHNQNEDWYIYKIR